jgi:hypothetical protein
MNGKIFELVILGLLSAFLCGLALVADKLIATVILAYLTCAIVLLLVALWKFGPHAYGSASALTGARTVITSL